jgi:type I site-specific restriction endonuclease
MYKKTLSERDICTKFITPAVEKSGWNKLTQLLEEVSFTDGKIYVRGKMTARGTKNGLTTFCITNPIFLLQSLKLKTTIIQ